MNDELESIWKESGRDLIEVLSQNMPEAAEKNEEKLKPGYSVFG
jgi:hypothetical protein